MGSTRTWPGNARRFPLLFAARHSPQSAEVDHSRAELAVDNGHRQDALCRIEAEAESTVEDTISREDYASI